MSLRALPCRAVVVGSLAAALAGPLAPARPAPASVDTPHPTSSLHDTYRVAAVRPVEAGPDGARDGAGDVAATPTGAPSVGDQIEFGETVTWLDGRTCRPWTPEILDGAAEGIDDPALSDLQISPAGEAGQMTDHRRNVPIEIECDGRFATLVVVDDRVFYTRVPTPDGDVWAVLERPLPPDEAAALQRRLAAAGFDPGPADGKIGAATRAAIGAYAEWRGADRPFEDGIVTENLLDGVVFSAAD